jgi:DNA-binding transcriptional ArsR family regulator
MLKGQVNTIQIHKPMKEYCGGKQSTSRSFKMAVCIVDNPDKIRLLADFTRAEILQLLNEHPMTEAQLSAELGLTRAAVGYHLHLLLQAELIYLERVEPEGHGILQKFYSPIAAFFIVDCDHIPHDVKRYFLQTQIMYLRGIFIAFQLHHRFFGVSPAILEKLALAMLRQLEETGRKYTKEAPVENAETLKVKIYAEVLNKLTKQDEWHALFKKPKNPSPRT